MCRKPYGEGVRGIQQERDGSVGWRCHSLFAYTMLFFWV